MVVLLLYFFYPPTPGYFATLVGMTQCILAECSEHGLTEFLPPNRNGRSYCKKCEEEWLNRVVAHLDSTPGLPSLSEAAATHMQELLDTAERKVALDYSMSTIPAPPLFPEDEDPPTLPSNALPLD